MIDDKTLYSTILRMTRAGYRCAQIIMYLTLELVGEKNDALVRAMSGLNTGMGGTCGACGVLTAGCAALGFFTGKGNTSEKPALYAQEIVARYAEWFRNTFGAETCKDLIKGDFGNCTSICPCLVEEGYKKLVELMCSYGIADT